MYQTLSSPILSGTLSAAGAVRKCSSIVWKPASISANFSGPIATTSERPIAESME